MYKFISGAKMRISSASSAASYWMRIVLILFFCLTIFQSKHAKIKVFKLRKVIIINSENIKTNYQ